MEERGGTRSGTWHALTEDVITGLEDWRSAHPEATFAEMEAEVEARLAELRARMLADAALASAARTGAAAGTEGRQVCPTCGGPLVARGEQRRQLRIRGDRQVALRRTYLTCTRCGRGVFPPG